MPIFERLRAQEQIPCAYPLHMGAGGTTFIRGGSRSMPLSPHAPHCHPSTHWVSYININIKASFIFHFFYFDKTEKE